MNTTPGYGPLDAKIAFIGEAWGEAEERHLQHKPFSGPAGDMLTKLTASVGINRANCFITNVVRERPPNNNIDVFVSLEKTDYTKAPRYPDYLAYVDLLKKELSTCQANVLVPLGGTALFALTGECGIMKWRGSIMESKLVSGRKVIPTIHPSAAVHQYLYTWIIRQDLTRILEESNSPCLDLPKNRLIIAPSLDQVMSYLEECKEADVIAADIEVVNKDVACISLCHEPDRAISIPFRCQTGSYWSLEHEPEVWLKLSKVLESRPIAGQNIAFDAGFLHYKHGIRVNIAHDTMVAHAIAYPDLPKGLDFITSVYTREPYYKNDGKEWFKFGGSDESFWIYNAKDSLTCFIALPRLLNDLSRMGNLETYKRQVSIIEPLVYLQTLGILVDTEGTLRLSQETDTKIKELSSEFDKMARENGVSGLNLASPKQLMSYFYMTLGHHTYTNEGRPTTDDTALTRLANKGCREAKLLKGIRHYTKLKNTYFDMVLDPDNRLRCSMNPVGTVTGRLSSSKTIFGTGMNQQNQPRAMRLFLLADPGHMVIEVDLSQAENHIVAYIAPDLLMQRAFEEGVDIHRQTAGLLFGIPPEEVSDEPGSCSIGDGAHSQRYWGKTANHSLNYGLGFRSFSLRFEIPERESKILVNRYRSVYSGIRNYWAWVEESLRKSRTITNPMGRRRLFLDRWGSKLFEAAYAHIPQSTVADVINERGLALVYRDGAFRAFKLLTQIHDSIVLEVPLSTGFEYISNGLSKLKKSLETPLLWRGKSFVLPAEAKIGLNFGQVKKTGILPEELEKTWKAVLVKRGT